MFGNALLVKKTLNTDTTTVNVVICVQEVSPAISY